MSEVAHCADSWYSRRDGPAPLSARHRLGQMDRYGDPAACCCLPGPVPRRRRPTPPGPLLRSRPRPSAAFVLESALAPGGAELLRPAAGAPRREGLSTPRTATDPWPQPGTLLQEAAGARWRQNQRRPQSISTAAAAELRVWAPDPAGTPLSRGPPSAHRRCSALAWWCSALGWGRCRPTSGAAWRRSPCRRAS